MSKINLLEIHVANLIAAGEVVDRPSSALKELIENAIDASASVITVEIKNGGITYMRVTDNGEGMDADDLGKSILRHSTSKIKSEKDLSKIHTLGFRGEALAAIASVTDVKIFSKRKDESKGYMLESLCGQNIKITETGCPNGTTVIAERLFYKVPARQKFLKNNITEGMSCKWITEKMALSNPLVSFKFISDGKEKLFTPGGGSIKNVVYSIYESTVADRLLEIQNTGSRNLNDNSKIRISGYISRIEDGAKSRVNENFFLNGRYIRSKTILSAMEEAYDSISETSKFPICVLYISIDESYADINVHPQKMEVKFSNDREIYENIYYAIKNTLQNSGITDMQIINEGNIYNRINTAVNAFVPLKTDLPPDTLVREQKNDTMPLYQKQLDTNQVDTNQVDTNQQSDRNKQPVNNEVSNVSLPQKQEITVKNESEYGISIKVDEVKNKSNENSYPQKNSPDYIRTYDSVKNENVTSPNPTKSNNPEKNINRNGLKNYKIIGQAFYGFIFVEKDDKIIIIDKHAAHERIIYDILKRRKNTEESKTQLLIFPLELKLSPDEYSKICEYRSEIEEMGIMLSIADEVVRITEVPAEMGDVNLLDIMGEMAYMLTEENFLSHEIAYEKIVSLTAKKTTACKAAMKNGINDEYENIEWLVSRVMDYEDIKYCPHGRPVAFEMKRYDIEKQFER